MISDVEPYYQTDGGMQTIYCGDSLELLPLMEPGSVDLVLTDPPYGMSYHKNHNPHEKVVGDTLPYPVEVIRQCMVIASNAIYTFCRWNNLNEMDTPKSFIVWVKNNWSAGDLRHAYARQWEGIAFYPLQGHAFKGRPADVLFADRVPPDKLSHPTEKPVPLIKQLLAKEIGDMILDPYLGSGSTLVACQQLGRRGVGIEISEAYCEIAKKRLAQYMLPGIHRSAE